MKIENIISKKLVTSNPESSIFEIAKLMKENNIGFIPIIDKTLIGVITDRDIVIKAIYNKDFNSPIKPYITNNIISIEADKDISEALQLMSSNKVKRLVVTKNNKLIGILSLSDILNSGKYDKEIISCLKNIWQLNNNNQNKNAEIDDFYL